MHIEGKIDGVGRAVVAHVGNHGNTPVNRFKHRFEQLHLLGVEHRGALACGTVHDKGIVTALYQAIGKLPHAGNV